MSRATAREPKAGDVAMVSALNKPEPYRAYYDGTTWREYDSHTFCVDSPTTYRALVIIDPEDLDQVVDLAAAFNATGSPQLGAVFIDRLQAALRSLVVPPKMDELTALGAVVADADDVCYVRGLPLAAGLDPQRPWWVVAPHGDRAARWLSWDEFTAVTVLAPGVTA